MVMEAQPSPQSVGREFVRQYYTLLNKAPNHLHRFYNNNSSFIHGESTLVVGQKNIHNRIQQLNFRDCHAKISQVDAQATLGNGVVVQVTGELSNDGQPMRRFTQTFVLAAQSPKKFYVHNDIFRYQDMYSDEENDGEARSENDEERETDPITSNNTMSVCVGVENSSQQQPLQPQAQVVPQQSIAGQQPPALGGPQQQQTIYYSMPQSVVAGAQRPVPVIAAQTVPLTQFATAGAAGIQAAQLNGVIGHQDILSGITQGQPDPNQGPSNLVAASIVPVVASAPPQILSAQQQQPSSASLAVSAGGQTGLSQTSAGTPNIPIQATTSVQHQQHQGTGVTAVVAIQQQLTGHSQTPAPLEDENVGSANDCNVSSQHQQQQQHGAAVPKTDQTPVIDDFKTINEQQQQEKYEGAAAAKQFSTNEPKTYANLFKSNNTSSTSSGSFVSLPPVQNQITTAQQQHQHGNQQKQQPQQQSQQQFTANTYSSSSSSAAAYIKNDSTRLENNNQQNNSGGLLQRNNSTRMNKDFDQRRTSNANSQQYSDSHQLFLGNVPHHATEEELRVLFSRFGHVMDLRIHSKTLAKVQGLRPPQNYGFITYDNPESVMNCLSNCPLFFPENSPDGQQLNVEEKKPRMRNLNDMPLRQSNLSGGNIGSNNMGGNSQRGSVCGGGGPNRSLLNSGGTMRGGGSGGNSLSRGSSGGGSRMSSGGFSRNENRGGPAGSGAGGPSSRNGNASNNPAGGNNYGSRR